MFSFLKSRKVSKFIESSDDSINATSELASKKTWAKSLSLTRSKLGQRLSQIFSSNGPIDDDLFEQLETILITSDVGVTATEQLIANTKSIVKRGKLQTGPEVKAALKSEMLRLLQRLCDPVIEKPGEPYVILIVGVNGAGKTTTIGKLTKQFTSAGKTVLLAAGDTFRAAAEEQIKIWGERNQVSVISQ